MLGACGTVKKGISSEEETHTAAESTCLNG